MKCTRSILRPIFPRARRSKWPRCLKERMSKSRSSRIIEVKQQTPNPKFQRYLEAPSTKNQAPEKLQSSNFQYDLGRKPASELGAWCFSGSWCLDLGAWRAQWLWGLGSSNRFSAQCRSTD